MLGVVVDFEWALRSHEVWICLRVVVRRHLLPIQSEAYYGSNIILSAVHAILDKLIQALVFSVEVVCRQIEPVHILLTPRQVLRRHVIRWINFCRRSTDGVQSIGVAKRSAHVINFMSATLSLTHHVSLGSL